MMTWAETKKRLEKYGVTGLPDDQPAGADLTDIDLGEADLRHADLHAVHLSRTDLTDADLRGAWLSMAKMDDTTLADADLRGATLTDTYLRRADLRRAKLERANLIGAVLSKADLEDATGLQNARDWIKAILPYNSDGFYAWKTFGAFFEPAYYWKIGVGETLVDRVNPDRRELCGEGINIATLAWVRAQPENEGLPVYKLFVPWGAETDGGVIVPYATGGKLRTSYARIVEVYE